MAKLTEGLADKLRVPAGQRDVAVFDTELPGFFLRKFASGRASYGVKFNIGKQQRRKTLGAVVRGNLKAMRLEASGILAKARLGVDTVADARAAAASSAGTLGTLVPKYLAAAKTSWPKSHHETTRYLTRSWAPLHALPIDGITRQHAVGALDEIERVSGKVSADQARAALSGLFAWAIDRGYCDSSPILNIRSRGQGGGRNRVLSGGELCAIWKACLDDDYGRLVRLLILLGQRRSELGGLTWPEVDLEKRKIELPPARTKNNMPHAIPLPDAAMDIISAAPRQEGRAFVFGNGVGGFARWSQAKAELDARLPPDMAPWVLHDVRRSVVTHLNELGVPPHVVEAIVNHTSGTRSGVAGIYNKALYLPERRRALELWAAHVIGLVTGQPSRVVPLRRARSAGPDAAE